MIFFNDNCYDAFLQYIIDNADTVHYCTQQPTNYTEATSTYSIGSKSGLVRNAVEDGAVDGRRFKIDSYVDGVSTGSGTVTHLAYVDTSNNILICVGLCTPNRVLSTGQVQGGGEFYVTLRDV